MYEWQVHVRLGAQKTTYAFEDSPDMRTQLDQLQKWFTSGSSDTFVLADPGMIVAIFRNKIDAFGVVLTKGDSK